MLKEITVKTIMTNQKKIVSNGNVCLDEDDKFRCDFLHNGRCLLFKIKLDYVNSKKYEHIILAKRLKVCKELTKKMTKDTMLVYENDKIYLETENA
jgi:hypothetical protein